MKIERLYAVTVYLLNHGRTSANELAKHFEVSQRTIQRDIDSLCMAGIPVIATTGASGGYEISETYRLDHGFATPDDYSYILTALHGLVSATGDRKAKQLTEKIIHASKGGATGNGMVLDFSVLQEGEQEALRLLQAAVAEKRTVEFTYTNNNRETRTHSVEPVAVLYRWYAWYLLAYSKVKQDYRTYKLVRMNGLRMTDMPFTKEHASADTILSMIDKTDSRRYTEILIQCRESVRTRVIEYLKGKVEEEFPNGDVLIRATVVENEQFWLGTLLSLGDQAEVLSPEHIRRQLLTSAEEIVSLYQKR
ncbi:MAG: YafY family transcriptional regulator [Lachnospiraceae bacterium]|nr:YafY family transcriptional regulator [Lachnospiraceae bacterium]